MLTCVDKYVATCMSYLYTYTFVATCSSWAVSVRYFIQDGTTPLSLFELIRLCII